MPIKPKIMVLSSLFPSSVDNGAGLFVRERMFRVAQHLPLFVVSPKPWFPLQSFIQLVKPHYRKAPNDHEVMQGIDVYFPKFISLPLFFRRFDGFFMALAVKKLLTKKQLLSSFDHIDAHFTYPDGYAGALLKKWLDKTLTITMRGTEVPHSLHKQKCEKMKYAWSMADKVITVSTSLKNIAIKLGAKASNFIVVGNGVDTDKFLPTDSNIRDKLSIPAQAKVIITVGGLVPRKGFHRVINAMPEVMKAHNDLHYLIIGGSTSEGNNESELRDLALNLGIEKHVHFLGKKPPEQLKFYLSSADLFILMSANEGWANVILESMACEKPVLASNVGGNAEVIAHNNLGEIIELNDHNKLVSTVTEMLHKQWNGDNIRQYALENSWQDRVDKLLYIFKNITEHKND